MVSYIQCHSQISSLGFVISFQERLLFSIALNLRLHVGIFVKKVCQELAKS